MKQEILYSVLSYKITGLCFKVHNELSRFAKEKQYCDRLEQLLQNANLHYEREVAVPFLSLAEDNIISGNIADFIINNEIIIECKAKKFITKQDYYQIQRYLQATGIKLGLLINFQDRYLKPKRIINYSLH